MKSVQVITAATCAARLCASTAVGSISRASASSSQEGTTSPRSEGIEPSLAQWLFQRCDSFREKTGTSSSAMQLSHLILDAIDKIDSDEDEFADKMQDMMFKLFAANRDIDFIMEVSERAFEIKDDEDVSKEVLTDVAIAEEKKSTVTMMQCPNCPNWSIKVLHQTRLNGLPSV